MPPDPPTAEQGEAPAEAESQKKLEAASRALKEATASGGPREYDLGAALEEVRAWVDDEQHAISVFRSNWVSLLTDFLATLEGCGPELRRCLTHRSPDPLTELKQCRTSIKNRKAPDRALIRRIRNVVTSLERLMAGPGVLGSAFEDLIAASPREREARARSFVCASAIVGHDAQYFPDRLRHVLAGDPSTVAAALREPPQDNDDDPVDSARRKKAVDALLWDPPTTGTNTVWLRFEHARLLEPKVLKLGRAVLLFDGDWLTSEYSDRSAELYELAPELIGRESSHVKYLIGEPSVSSDELRDRCVFIRVVVRRSTATGALRVAQRTADAISGLAALHGTPSALWELDPSFVTLGSSGDGPARFSRSAHSRLETKDQVALRADGTSRVLSQLSERLGPHLPVEDPAIDHAATLLSWLRGAKLAPPAPRLLLCDRVVEQVSGWSGFADPRAFIAEVVEAAWVVRRLHNQVAQAAFVASFELSGINESGLVESFAEPRQPHQPRGSAVRLDDFLENFDVISTTLADHPTRPYIHDIERVISLTPLVESPRATAEWLGEQAASFRRMEARRRRTRNALVHGGPLSERTVESCVEFAESTAALALGECITGRLEGRDLVDHFLDLRRNSQRVFDHLKDGWTLAEALFD